MLLLLLACTQSEAPADDTAPGKPAPEEPTSVLGPADQAPEDVAWTIILDDGDRLTDPRDLGFDPEGRLWVANREDDRTFIVTDPGTDAQDVERRRDGYAEHFMEETAALAFEDPSGASEHGNEFGSCGDSFNTYNGQYPPNYFMGPVLWTTDLDVFAEQNPDGLGSHLDMLHESPLCVGIAWEKDNVYWVFDGYNSSIARYDFVDDHNVGQDDHSDGIIYRYEEPVLTHVPNAPGHMVFDHETGLLYVADTGGGRILWLDTTTGEEGEAYRRTQEPVDTYAAWEGAEWGELLTGLDQPGGLALADGRLIVGEWGTGKLYDYTLDGELVRTLDTGLGAGALYGIEVGPDGLLWVTETATPSVRRLDL